MTGVQAFLVLLCHIAHVGWVLLTVMRWCPSCIKKKKNEQLGHWKPVYKLSSQDSILQHYRHSSVHLVSRRAAHNSCYRDDRDSVPSRDLTGQGSILVVVMMLGILHQPCHNLYILCVSVICRCTMLKQCYKNLQTDMGLTFADMPIFLTCDNSYVRPP